jgi:hypothetical protein
MPTPFDPDPLAPPATVVDRRLWAPAQQDYAAAHVRGSHDEALYRLGEYAIFVLLWRIRDHRLGLVERCSVCFTAYGEFADVYKQPMEHNCPHCLGTTFEGGYRAKIVRPSLWDFGEETNDPGRRGEHTPAVAAVQATSDFRMRTGDFVLRADGTRWRTESLSANHLRTGFGHPWKADTAVGFNYGQVRKVDRVHVAFEVEPTKPSELRLLLDPTSPHFPVDFSAHEDIRVPLSPDADFEPDDDPVPDP